MCPKDPNTIHCIEIVPCYLYYLQVIESAEIENLNPDLAMEFFQRKVYPHAAREYQIEQATESELPASRELLIVALLVRYIKVYKVPVTQVLKWVLKLLHTLPSLPPFVLIQTVF